MTPVERLILENQIEIMCGITAIHRQQGIANFGLLDKAIRSTRTYLEGPTPDGLPLYWVTYNVGKVPGEIGLMFECYAMDPEHAREQCENAYPGCKVTSVARGVRTGLNSGPLPGESIEAWVTQTSAKA